MILEKGFPEGDGPHDGGWHLCFVDGNVAWADADGANDYELEF